MRPRSVSGAPFGGSVDTGPHSVRRSFGTSYLTHSSLRSEGGCQVGPVRLGTFGCHPTGVRSDVESSTETTTSVGYDFSAVLEQPRKSTTSFVVTITRTRTCEAHALRVMHASRARKVTTASDNLEPYASVPPNVTQGSDKRRPGAV